MSSLKHIKQLYEQLSAFAADERFRGSLPHADWQIAAHNPYCGDDITLYICLEGGHFAAIRYDGFACQVCCASTAIMASELTGRPLSDLTRLYDAFTRALRDDPAAALPDSLNLFEAIRNFPVRRKCALLPWKATHEHMADVISNETHD